MISENEIICKAESIQDDIYYFTNYKFKLSNFLVKNSKTLSQLKTKKIIREIEIVVIYIEELKIEKTNCITILNKMTYGDIENQ
jgi:hypothetical protein